MSARKIPFIDRWFKFKRSSRWGYEEELVEYCIYQRLHLGFFCIETNDWSENA